jgi:hypothetical protein
MSRRSSRLPTSRIFSTYKVSTLPLSFRQLSYIYTESPDFLGTNLHFVCHYNNRPNLDAFAYYFYSVQFSSESIPLGNLLVTVVRDCILSITSPNRSLQLLEARVVLTGDLFQTVLFGRRLSR